MKVIKMIGPEEAEYKEVGIGGLGGYFSDGMRWADYFDTLKEDVKPYAQAMREYIIEHKIKEGGDWHQNNEHGTPLFKDGKIASFSFRAWGDIMAAIWAEAEDKDYSYMDFYMSGWGRVY